MESEQTGKKPSYLVLENGYIVPGSTNVERFNLSLTYAPKDDDIFICTYPKSGTTWAQCILNLLKNKGKPLEPDQNINKFIPHIEFDGKDVVEQLPSPRIIKTHLPYNLVPKNSKSKYICMARNPKDCCVSFFHHTKGFWRYYFFDGTFDDYFELFLAGQVDCGDYFDHLLSWLEHRSDPNVLFLLYEDMKRDTRGMIQRMGEFLGGEFLESVSDPMVMENVLLYSSHKVMKSIPSMWSTERPEQFEPFIRKGEIGDWKNYFSDEQSERLDRRFYEKLSGTEAERFWQDYI